MKNIKKTVIASLATIGVSCAIIGGATFAYFTSEAGVDITVTSGKVNVTAEVVEDSIKYYTMDQATETEKEDGWLGGSEGSYSDGKFTLNNITPGAGLSFQLKITNNSTVDIKYQFKLTGENLSKSEYNLIDAFKVVAENDGEALAFINTGSELATVWTAVEAGTQEDLGTYDVDIYLPWTTGKNYQGLECSLSIGVFAVQGNANPDIITLNSVEDVNNVGSNLAKGMSYAGKTVSLGKDIDLSGKDWTPIGSKEDKIYFDGIFDGNGHTIKGLSISEGKYAAFIGAAKNATIKNLTVEGEVSGADVGGIVARVEGNTVIENCTNKVKITSSTKAGGVACIVTNSGITKFINCRNEADISNGPSGIGGIVGYVNNDAYVEIINCKNSGTVSGKYAGAAVGYAAANCKGFIDGMENTGTISYTALDLSGGRYLMDEAGVVLCGYCGKGMWKLPVEISSSDDLAAALSDAKEGDTIALAEGTYDEINLTSAAEISNLTIIGREGASVAGFMYNTSHVTNTNGKIDGLTFKNITFTDTVYIATSSVSATINNVTFENCSFDLSNLNWQTNTSAQAIRYYNESNTNGGVYNLTVKDCTFTNCYQGVYTQHAVNVTVTGCTFENIKHNAIAIQDQAKYAPISHGDVVITNNKFINVTERPIRFGRLDVDTTLTITGNVAVNSMDSEGQIMKTATLAEDIKASANISGNDWNGTGKDGVELIVIG